MYAKAFRTFVVEPSPGLSDDFLDDFCLPCEYYFKRLNALNPLDLK